MNILLRNYEYNRTFDLKINVGHCDLYFMVQWFCLIFWRLFDVLRSYFGIMSQYDTTFDFKINVGHCDLYFMVQWFYLMKTIWYMNTILWDYESVWLMFDLKIFCSTLWPIFHGPVILPNVLKTIQWLNVILWDYESVWPDMWPPNICRSLWPIFHGPLNFPLSWRLFDVWTSYFRIMSQYDTTFDLKSVIRPLTSK